MAENPINYYDIRKVMAYLKEFYNFFEDMPIIKEMDNISSKNLTQEAIERFSKYVIQFLFMNNFTILKSRTSNAIRHIFPPDIDNYDEFMEFFGILIKLFKTIDIDIEIVGKNLEDLRNDFSERYLYFYFQNYKSIFKFLLSWDESLGTFSKSRVKALKEFFQDFEIYIHFNEKYMNQIFGEKGLINKEKITATKLFENIFNLRNYKRHSIYKWRDELFFPTTVIIDINKSKYRDNIDIDFYKYIKHIKIGKAQKINKDLLDQIKNNYDGNFDRFLPESESMLGYILSQKPLAKEKRPNFAADFKAFLSEIPSYVLDRYKKEIISITERLTIPDELIILKSLKMINFKSYSEGKIDFQNGINILYGANGTGKTTIIDAIFFALFMDDTWQKLHINDFYDLEFRILNTYQIRVGEEYCEIELDLIKGEENIKIIRKLWKDGRHKLFINNEDIFETIKLDVIERFKEEVKKIENREAYTIEEIGGKPRLFIIPTKYKFFIDGDINEKICQVLKLKKHFIEIERYSGDFADIYAVINGVAKDDIDIDDFNQFIDDLGESLSVYFRIINEEIESKYKDVRCLFEKSEIYSSLFQEFSSIDKDLYSESSTLHDFILNKFGVNFIEKNLIHKEENKLQKTKDKRIELISRVYDDPELLALDEDMPTIYDMYEDIYDWDSKIIEEFEEYFLYEGSSGIEPKYAKKFKEYTSESKKIVNKIKFLNEIKDFLFFLFSEKINEKLIEISKEFFQKEEFYSFLDKKGVPKIKFYEKDEILPLSCLSGGERSKLILILLSLLINISNRSSFFLIDEPNELLDPYNIENMKLLFTRIFENRQIIICTFIESYKSFKPARIYQIEKMENISYITQIAPIEEVNLRKLEICLNRLKEIFEENNWRALDKTSVILILELEEELSKKLIESVIDELVREGTLYKPKPDYIKFRN